MSRILVTADLHLGLKRFGSQTPEGNSRVLDFAGTLERFVDTVFERECAWAALVGDTFHTRHPGPRELALFTEQMWRLSNAGVVTFIVPGNHDGMDTIGDPTSHTLAWMRAARMDNIHVLTEPGVQRYENHGTSIIVTAIPYPHRRALATEGGDPGANTEEVSRRVERLVEVLGKEARARSSVLPSIFLGHLSVANSKLGSEQSMRIGWDVTIRREVLDVFNFSFLGHIHKAQMLGERAMYVGSPDFHLFEDSGQSKAFVLAELNVGDPSAITLSRIDSKARQMHRIVLDQQPDGSFYLPLADTMPGCMMELVLHATVERPRQAEQARLREEALRHGASFVKIDVHNDLPETRSHGIAVKAEDAPEAALEAWLGGQEDIPVEPTLTVGKQLIASTLSDAA